MFSKSRVAAATLPDFGFRRVHGTKPSLGPRPGQDTSLERSWMHVKKIWTTVGLGRVQEYGNYRCAQRAMQNPWFSHALASKWYGVQPLPFSFLFWKL